MWQPSSPLSQTVVSCVADHVKTSGLCLDAIANQVFDVQGTGLDRYEPCFPQPTGQLSGGIERQGKMPWCIQEEGESAPVWRHHNEATIWPEHTVRFTEGLGR